MARSSKQPIVDSFRRFDPPEREIPQRVDAEGGRRGLAFAVPIVVLRRRERPARGRVHHDDRDLRRQRDVRDVERSEVDPERLAATAQRAGQLIEETRTRHRPIRSRRAGSPAPSPAHPSRCPRRLQRRAPRPARGRPRTTGPRRRESRSRSPRAIPAAAARSGRAPRRPPGHNVPSPRVAERRSDRPRDRDRPGPDGRPERTSARRRPARGARRSRARGRSRRAAPARRCSRCDRRSG